MSHFGEIKLYSCKNHYKLVAESYCGRKETIAVIDTEPESAEVNVFEQNLTVAKIWTSEIDKVEIDLLKPGEAHQLGLRNLWVCGKTDDPSLVPCINQDGASAQSRPDFIRQFVPKITIEAYEPSLNKSSAFDIPRYVVFKSLESKSRTLYNILDHEVLNAKRNLCRISVIPTILPENIESCIYSDNIEETLESFKKKFLEYIKH